MNDDTWATCRAHAWLAGERNRAHFRGRFAGLDGGRPRGADAHLRPRTKMPPARWERAAWPRRARFAAPVRKGEAASRLRAYGRRLLFGKQGSVITGQGRAALTCAYTPSQYRGGSATGRTGTSPGREH